MLRKLLLTLLLCCLSAVTCPVLSEPDNTDLVNVDPSIVLKGLKTARLLINVNRGAHHLLHTIGVNSDKVENDLHSAVLEKMQVLPDLKLTPSSGPPGDSQMLVEVATDEQTGVFSVVMAIQELVTLNREPHPQAWLTTWSIAQHPKSNEEIPIRNSVSDLADQFVDAYLTANGKSSTTIKK